MRRLSLENPRHVFWLLTGILLLGLGLRVINFGTEPFWGDEILSLDIARHFKTASEMLAYLRDVEFHPPLYYLLMRAWSGAWGATEVAARMPSLVFGEATILAVWWAAKRLFSGAKAGIVAALIIAVLPMQLEFSQEARPYTLLCLLVTVMAVALWDYLRKGRPWTLAVYIIASIIGFYVHYSFILFFAAGSAWWLYEIARKARGTRARALVTWLSAHALVFVGFFPWADALAYKTLLGRYPIFGMMRDAFPHRSLNFFEAVIALTIWLKKGPEPLVTKMELFAQLAFVLILVACVIRVIRVIRVVRATPEKRTGPHPLSYLAWLSIPPLVLYFFSPQSYDYAPIYVRHVIFLNVPFALFLGWLAERLSPKQAALLVSMLCVSLVPRVADIAGNDALWDPYFQLSSAADTINTLYRPGDLVVVDAYYDRTHLTHYLRPEIPVDQLMPLAYTGLDVWDSRATPGLIEDEMQIRSGPSTVTMDQKMRFLMWRYRPKRVWLYFFKDEDHPIYGWFQDQGWRHVMSASRPIFLFDLYAKN